jgi:hypothetical protein
VCLVKGQNKELETLQVTNNIVQSRIQYLSADTEKQLVSRLNPGLLFSFQLDETTDTSG